MINLTFTVGIPSELSLVLLACCPVWDPTILELKHVWYGCLFVDFMLGISLLILTDVAANAVFQNVFHCQFCSGSNANSVIR